MAAAAGGRGGGGDGVGVGRQGGSRGEVGGRRGRGDKDRVGAREKGGVRTRGRLVDAAMTEASPDAAYVAARVEIPVDERDEDDGDDGKRNEAVHAKSAVNEAKETNSVRGVTKRMRYGPAPHRKHCGGRRRDPQQIAIAVCCVRKHFGILNLSNIAFVFFFFIWICGSRRAALR